MGGLSNYREVGKFDVLEAPRNPIGAFDAECFKKEALELYDKGSNNIVVDLGNLDFLYSDAFNAFSMVHQKLASRSGTLGILASDDLAVKSLQQAGVDRYVKVFRTEPELMSASLQSTPAKTSSIPVVEVPSSGSVMSGSMPPSMEQAPAKRAHKFTQSFNSTLSTPEEAAADLKGMGSAFDSEMQIKSSNKGLVIGILVVLAAAGGAAFFFLR